jgi:ketosteroid isomerase-like protein
MSKENVEIVKATFEAWNADDMDAYRDLLDPDVTMTMPPNFPERGPFLGREAVLGQYLSMREAFDFDRAEPTSDFSHAADRVVARMRWLTAGHGPRDVVPQVSCIYTVRHGKLTGFEFFWDHAEALEAAGLSE